jgi:hypothetical protein
MENKMRKFLLALAAFFTVAVSVFGQATVTPNVGLQIPAYAQTNWQVPYNYDLNLLDRILGGLQTLPTGATPQITQFANWTTANTMSTTITNFTNGLPQQTIRIFCGVTDTYTTISNSANISVAGTWSCPNFLSLQLTLLGTVWTETGRSGGNAAAGVSTWSGDGNFATNSGSTGPTTMTLHTAGAHMWWGNPTGSTAAPGYHSLTASDLPAITESMLPGTTVFTDQNATFGAHTYDFSGVTRLNMRVGAGLTTVGNGDFGFDTTHQNWHIYANGLDNYAFVGSSALTYTNNDCAKFSNASGTVTIADAGAPCYTSSILFLTSNYTNSTTTFTNVPGWSFAAAANTNYALHCDFTYQESLSGAQLQLQVTGPSSPTAVEINFSEFGANYSGPSYMVSNASAFSTPVLAGQACTSGSFGPCAGTLTMTLINGANAGTVQVQAAATAAHQVTIYPGYCKVN